MEQQKTNRHYTYADYLTWADDERWEIIDGVAYAMAPSPNLDHQTLSFELSGYLRDFLKGKPCQGFAAPFDLRFSQEDDTDTIVQPDLMVVCDEEKITPHGIVGAPTLIIEIISPSTAVNDFTRKRELYERHGVAEYWIITPSTKTIHQYSLVDGRYLESFHKAGAVDSLALPGLRIDLSSLFSRVVEA